MELYVDIKFLNNSGDGTKEKPFGTISEAAAIAKPGDTVHVAPGLYREYVSPTNGGTEDAPITYVSDEPLGATISGAEQITTWKPYDGNVWVCRVDNRIFGDYNPYTTFCYGDWYFAGKNRHVGCVYINDRRLYEAASVEEVIKAQVYKCSWVPEESKYKWYAEDDGGGTLKTTETRQSSTQTSAVLIPTAKWLRSTSGECASSLRRQAGTTSR